MKKHILLHKQYEYRSCRRTLCCILRHFFSKHVILQIAIFQVVTWTQAEHGRSIYKERRQVTFFIFLYSQDPRGAFDVIL
jgi:hypothetical protein